MGIFFNLSTIALSGGGGGTSLTAILALATELLTWTITSMTSYLTFIEAHPLVLVMFIVVIVGFAWGMLSRIWRSVGR